MRIGDVLNEHDSEPPVGTTVELHDGERWQRLATPGEWSWGAEHNNWQPVWRWRRVVFDGPVTVVGTPFRPCADCTSPLTCEEADQERCP